MFSICSSFDPLLLDVIMSVLIISKKAVRKLLFKCWLDVLSIHATYFLLFGNPNLLGAVKLGCVPINDAEEAQHTSLFTPRQKVDAALA